MQKDEINKAVDEIVNRATRDEKHLEMEAFIAEVKSEILKNVGERIASHALVRAMSATDETKGQVRQDVERMRHTAFLIAQAAEMVMRRTWLD